MAIIGVQVRKTHINNCHYLTAYKFISKLYGGKTSYADPAKYHANGHPSR